MNSILIGNGLIIQFGGEVYTNRSIINRAINNVLAGRLPVVDYPEETVRWIYILHGELQKDV